MRFVFFSITEILEKSYWRKKNQSTSSYSFNNVIQVLNCNYGACSGCSCCIRLANWYVYSNWYPKTSTNHAKGVLKSIPDDECTRKTKPGDSISVHYEGKLDDGSVFDSSFKRDSPISFKLGVGQVIQGWDQGLSNMCIGEKRKLIIPPELGYGNRNIGPIPAGSTLTFIAELVDIAGSQKNSKDEL